MSSPIDINAKAAHLLAGVDFSRPELAGVRDAEGLLAYLQQSLRGRFLFEYQRKAEMLAFLREHYAAWQSFNTAAAERLANFTIPEAQQPRATAGIAELGKAWWATGDLAWGAAFQRFYLDTPTGDMFTWYSFNGSQGYLELSAWFLLQDCHGFTTDGRIAFLDHLYSITVDAWDTHTSQWDQLSLGPEGHNWYIHGVIVLPFFGLLFPEFTRSTEFLRSGWSMVEEHMRGHYRADGGARETTLGYQIGSLMQLWELYLIAHRNGYPVSAGLADRMLNATLFLLRLMTPDGSVPAYGDSGYTPGGLTTLASIATAITGDRECKWYAETCRQYSGAVGETPNAIPESAFWLTGLEGAAAYAQTRARDPRHVSVLMGDTGYAALREGDRYLAIAAADRGPIVTSHGHNDIFSLEVHAKGERFLGQEGINPYGESPGRDYDQTTQAHTTLTIAGMEQTALISEWRWSQVTIPAVRRWISEPTHDFFHGVHEGFYRWPEHQVLHARKVFFVKAEPSYWVVVDWLNANVENEYEIYFHGCRPGRIDGDRILLTGDHARLTITPIAEDGLQLKAVDSPGRAAYLSEIHADADRFPAYVYRRRAESTTFAWIIAPGEAPFVRRLPVTLNGQPQDAWGATALEIRFPNHTDLFCLSHRDFDGTLEFAGKSAFGFLAFYRQQTDGTETLAINHTMPDGVCGR